jgi:hypothetical protein
MTRTSKPWRLVGLLVAVGLLVGLGSLAWALSTSVRLVAPKTGAVLKGTAVIQGEVSASGVTFVILGVDNQRAFSTNSAPYSFSLDTTELADGPHTLFIEAYGRGGVIARSGVVKVYVKNTTAKPVRVPAEPASTMQVRSPKSKPVAQAKTLSPATLSKVPGASTQPGNMPLALTAEPKMTPQAVSLPPMVQPVAKALASEPKSTPVAVASGTLRPTPAQLRLSPTAVATVSLPPTTGVRTTNKTTNNQAISLDGLRGLNGSLDAGFRKVMTAAGWKVIWVPATQSGKAEAAGHVLEVVLGKDQVIVDGKVFPLGRKVVMTDNRLVVALRPLCQAAGITLIWDAKTRTAKLVSPYQRTTTVSLAK